MADPLPDYGIKDWTPATLPTYGINDWTPAAPPPPPPPEPPPAPVSSTIGGMVQAGWQVPTDAAAGALQGVGAAVKSAGTLLQASASNAQNFTTQQTGIINRIDAGDTVPAMDDPLGYGAASPEQRATIKQGIEGNIAAMPKPEDTTLGQVGAAIKTGGGAVMDAGALVRKAGEDWAPLTDEEKGRFSVQGVKMIGGLAEFIGAGIAGGAVGGPEGAAAAVIGVAGVHGFGTHYQAVKNAGGSDELAAATGLFGGLVDGGMMAVPVGKAVELAGSLPGMLAKGEFLTGVWELAKSAGTMITFSQLQTIADNAVAKASYKPDQKILENVGNPRDILLQGTVGAVLPGVGMAMRGAGNLAARGGGAIARRLVGNVEGVDLGGAPPEPGGAPSPGGPEPGPPPIAPDQRVLAAPDIDSAINAAAEATQATSPGAPPEASKPPPAPPSAPIGESTAPPQLRGGIEATANGGYQFRQTDASGTDTVHPMDVWNPDAPVAPRTPGATTIAPDTAIAIRDHYAAAGVRTVFYQGDTGLPFDGTVDPAHPNTIFLSNDPTRNIAQVAGHEFTHVLDSVTLPDGTSLGDLLNQQVAAGITPAGQRYAAKMFGDTAPGRDTFPTGSQGTTDHAAAVQAHLINELGTDIGGEAPKFQSFIPKVMDAIQARFGDSVAADMLRKMMDGLRSAMDTIRGLFEETGTRSQNWVTNIGEVHDTLARMYAERFGTPVEREQGRLATMRDQAERDRFVAPKAEPETQPGLPTTGEAQAPAEPLSEKSLGALSLQADENLQRMQDGQTHLRLSTTPAERDALRGLGLAITDEGMIGYTDAHKLVAMRDARPEAVNPVENLVSQPPTPAPETAPPSTTGLAVIGNMGSAMGENLRALLWEKVQAGKTTEAGAPSNLLTLAKSARDAGGLQTEADFRSFINAVAPHLSDRSEGWQMRLLEAGRPFATSTSSTANRPLPPPTEAAPAAQVPAATSNQLAAAPGFRDIQTTAHARSLQLRRWLDELAADRTAAAASHPKLTVLKQTEAAILRLANGNEANLPPMGKARLADVRAQIDVAAHPTSDTPAMATVRTGMVEAAAERAQLQTEQEAIAQRWDQIGNPGMAQAVRAGAAQPWLSRENVDFNRGKLDAAIAKAEPGAPKPAETFSLVDFMESGSAGMKKALADIEAAGSPEAKAMVPLVQQAGQLLTDKMNGLGFTREEAGQNRGGPEGDARKRFSHVLSDFSRFASSEIALRKGYQRASEVERNKNLEALRNSLEAAGIAPDALGMTDTNPVANPVSKAPAPAATSTDIKGPNGDFGNYSMFSPGARFTSESGRALEPVPKFRDPSGSNAAFSRARKTIDRWLITEAMAEAKAKGDTHLASILARQTVDNFSMYDRDTAMDVVFGNDRGPEARHGAVQAATNPVANPVSSAPRVRVDPEEMQTAARGMVETRYPDASLDTRNAYARGFFAAVQGTEKPGGKLSHITDKGHIDGTAWLAEQHTKAGAATNPVANPVEPAAPTIASIPNAPETPEKRRNAPSELESLDPVSVRVDPARFQFKSETGEAGVSERLQGVTSWDPRFAGTALVWRDAEGNDFVADGHQRFALAKRLMAEGHPPIRVNAFVLNAAEGITDAQARTIAAVKNIGEGTGSPLDAAKIIREAAATGIELPPLPPNSILVRDGRALARLGPDAFGMAINKVVPVNQAAMVGRLVVDHAQQNEAMRILATAKPENARQAEMMIRDMLASGTEQDMTQGGLFGAESFASSVTLERAKVVDEAVKQLARDKTTFRTLVAEAERIEGHGANVLDAGANQARLTADEQASQLLGNLATHKGPVSDGLTAVARRFKNGDITRADAAREFLGIVRGAMEAGVERGPNAGGPEPGAAGGVAAPAVEPAPPAPPPPPEAPRADLRLWSKSVADALRNEGHAGAVDVFNDLVRINELDADQRARLLTYTQVAMKDPQWSPTADARPRLLTTLSHTELIAHVRDIIDRGETPDVNDLAWNTGLSADYVKRILIPGAVRAASPATNPVVNPVVRPPAPAPAPSSKYLPPSTGAELLAKLAKLQNRATAYEAEIVRPDGTTNLLAYIQGKSTSNLRKAMAGRAEAIAKFLGPDHDSRFTMGQDAAYGATIKTADGAVIRWTGRTKRDATMEGALPYVGDHVADGNSVANPVVSPEAAPSASLVPAPLTHPEPIPQAPEVRTVTADHRLANRIAAELEKPHAAGTLSFGARELQGMAEFAYGGTLAEGAYSRDRLYDAVELGVNRFIQNNPHHFNPAVTAKPAERIARELAVLKESLPTQTVRAGEKDAYQQFSTPPDYAYAAAWVANLRPEDHVLEPSAGVGGLVVHAMNAGVQETTVNELSDKRRGMIAALNPTRVSGEDAAQLHNILPVAIRPTVVLMNPPFSRAAERMGGRVVLDEGAKHIEQALARLEPGGRLVAIVGDGMKPEGTVTPGSSMRQGSGKRFTDWWKKIGAEYDVRANVGVDRDIYTKYGTSFPTRLLVIDKNPPSGRPLVTGQAQDAAELIAHLEGVRNERSPVERVTDQPVRADVAAGGEGVAEPGRLLLGPTGDVGAGEGRGPDPATDVAEPAGATQSGVGGGFPADVAAGGPSVREPVVPVKPQSGSGGTGRKPRPSAGTGSNAPGSGGGGGGDGLRPDGSGERDQPGLTPAPEEVLATENAVSAPDNQAVNEAVYESYAPQRARVTGAKPHPGPLVQSAAMATVVPPATTYKPRIPASLVRSGALSDAQLEAIVYAGHAHTDIMGTEKRRGFFIGDGTGVGKGREIAGIILDNFQNGRTKAVWVSEKRALVNDARRDWNGMGQPVTDVIDHGKLKPGDVIQQGKGILFTSYDTLKSEEKVKVAAVEGEVAPTGKTRVQQIIDWVGKDFDGVIAFDEAHAMGNSTDQPGSRGVKRAALKALAGIELQNQLPNARVVYVSATGATEVSNLAYADRLGLWGEGTAFPTKEDFIGQVSSGGIAGMELVARDMKALGHYIARNLSYDGVDYDRVEHVLTTDQRHIYDKMAEAWQLVLQHFDAALEATGATEDGATKNGQAKAAARSAFWGAHQRFFNQIITSMQMPSVIRGVETDMKEGRQAVLQLVNTMEAAQERALAKARAAGEGDLEDLDMTPRDQLMHMVEKSYPVQQMEEYADDNGNIRSRPAKDRDGNPVINQELVRKRDKLLDQLGSLRVPDGPLEILLNHFGVDKVAEVTGRKQRVVRKEDDAGDMKTIVEQRGSGGNVADAAAFQAGKKPILVFSEAGGTGRSYHAENGSGSAGARRSHYLVQGGWRADKAVQGFGRTHRTNQASAPIFHLVTTDLQGQKRFISSIARRLSQLGALTKGERRAADQGMFGMRDNLESTEAKDGLRQFFRDVYAGAVEGVAMDDLENTMGLKMRDTNGVLVTELPEMSQFLNRVLSLTYDHQNRVFNAFSDRMDLAIARASAAGTLDTGVETYKADKISKVSEQTVYTDPRSGAETKHVHLNAQNRNEPVSFAETMAGRNKTNGARPERFVQNNQSGRVFAVTPGGNYTDKEGRIVPQVRLTSPTDYQFVDRENIDRDNWKLMTSTDAKPLWDEQVATTPEFRNSALHIITGAVLPIWDRLGGNPKIFRLQTEDGERLLGRVIPAGKVEATLKSLGAESTKITATPVEIGQQILGGATAKLANDWTIKRSMVAGEPRIELVGPDYRYTTELARYGVFSERINYASRFFIPTKPAEAGAAIEAITKTRPITEITGGKGAQFSPKAIGAAPDDEAFTPKERQAVKNVRGSTDQPTWRETFDDAKKDLGLKLVNGLFDSYVGVKVADPAGYMAVRLANSTSGAHIQFMENGTLKFEGSHFVMDERNGGVLNHLIKPLQGEENRFIWWVAAHRAGHLTTQDRENLWSENDIDTIKGFNRGNVPFDYTLANGSVTRSREAIYLDSLKKLEVFNRNTMHLAVQSGLVSVEAANEFLKNPYYVPFYRQREESEFGKGTFSGASISTGFVKQHAFKKLEGGTEKLNPDLWDNAFKNWAHMIDASLKNRAAAGVLDTAVTNGAAEERTERQVLHSMNGDAKKRLVWVMNDGRRQYYEITDPMLYTAITALNDSDVRFPGMDGLRKFKTLFTNTVTLDPRFMLRVTIKDAEQAAAVSPLPLNIIANTLRGMKMADFAGAAKNVGRAMVGKDAKPLRLDDEAADAIAGGATMHLSSGHDSGHRLIDTDTMLDTPEKARGFLTNFGKTYQALRETMAQSEDVQRFAIYHEVRAQGGAKDFAAFSARDMEDFTLRGSWPVVRFLAQTVPFLNANLQGLYKVGRAASNADRSISVAVGKRIGYAALRKLTIMMAATALTSLALDLIYADDEDNKKRTDYDRNNYFWWKIGNTQFRLPMGFEVAALGRIATLGFEATFGLSEMTGQRFVNQSWDIFKDNLFVSLVPQAIAPLWALLANDNGRGGTIVSDSMKKMQSQDRFTPQTTLAARGASALGSSAARGIFGPQAQFLAPVQIDALVQGYFGWLGATTMAVADNAFRGADQAQAGLRGVKPAEPVRADKDLWAYLSGGMIAIEPTAASRYLDTFYEQKGATDRAYASYQGMLARQETEKARAFFGANKDVLAKHEMLGKLGRDEAEISKQMRRVEASPTLTAAEKHDRIAKYEAMRNKAAENIFGSRRVSP